MGAEVFIKLRGEISVPVEDMVTSFKSGVWHREQSGGYFKSS